MRWKTEAPTAPPCQQREFLKNNTCEKRPFRDVSTGIIPEKKKMRKRALLGTSPPLRRRRSRPPDHSVTPDPLTGSRKRT